jgi:hypothetical protein
MAMTYAQLLQAVQDYTENTESGFVSNIPLFTAIAEERVYNTVQIPALRKNSTGVMAANNKYLSMPSDWLATHSLSVSVPGDASATQYVLLNKDVEFIREAFPSPTAYGRPTHYAVFDMDSFILGPTPDQSYVTELHYFYYPTSIVSASTSWLGNNFENVLLYGTLREAYLYMKGEQDMVKYYEDKYLEGMVLLKQLCEGKDRRDSYRSGQLRSSIQ